MKFIRPIEVSEEGLVTEYVDAESLIENPSPHLYREFGETLREFHELGYVHSHLQFNDVLHNDSGFYLTDLPYLNEQDAVHDLAVPKIGLDSFRIKQPWRWRLYTRCFDAFLRGYGPIDRPEFEQAYADAFSSRVGSLRATNTDRKRSLKARVLTTAKRIGIIGPA